MNAACQFY